ncbi:ORF6N domain-containing protein [Sphingobacterium faecale]
MLDFHLAKLYQVENRVLKQAVKRKQKRFSEDFIFKVYWIVSDTGEVI